MQGGASDLTRATFQTVALVSTIPAVLAVVVLAVGVRDVPHTRVECARRHRVLTLAAPRRPVQGVSAGGRPVHAGQFVGCLPHPARSRNSGLSVPGVMGNAVYRVQPGLHAGLALAGALSDRIGRRRLIVGGWLAYAAIHLGFGLAGASLADWRSLRCMASITG